MREGLSVGGWIFMVGAWSVILLLNVYCFGHITREKKEEIAEPFMDEQDVVAESGAKPGGG